jgi:hypothetical protein
MDDSEWAIDAPSRRPAAQLVPGDDAQVARTWRCGPRRARSYFCEFSLVASLLTHSLQKMESLYGDGKGMEEIMLK